MNVRRAPELLTLVIEKNDVRHIAALSATRTICSLSNPVMLSWALICAICALIFGILGFSGLARGFAVVAKFLLAVFLILLVITLIFGGLFVRVR